MVEVFVVTFEFTGLRGFSRRSGAMMGYPARTTSSKVLAVIYIARKKFTMKIHLESVYGLKSQRIRMYDVFHYSLKKIGLDVGTRNKR